MALVEKVELMEEGQWALQVSQQVLLALVSLHLESLNFRHLQIRKVDEENCLV